MLREYTDRFQGFQIRDINYLGEPPKDAPVKFDVVRWAKNSYGESNEYCFSVAQLIYNAKEPCFELHSIGMRWVDAHPSKEVEEWISAWCDYKLLELVEE